MERLAIDCDDVLLDFNSGLAEFHNQNFGTNYTLSNLDDCVNLGIKPILFRRPWNKYLTDEKLISEGIYPANSWEEIVKTLD